MGCGSSKVEEHIKVSNAPRKSIVLPPPPEIDLVAGPEVKPFAAPPASRVIAVFGGPGSGKGRVVAQLCSMFGMNLVSSESLIFKYLPKKVAHTSELKTTKDIIDLIRKEPEKVQLDWILRLVQHHVEQDPNKIYIVDLLPNLKWLQRNEYMSNNASELLGQLEEKVQFTLALDLSLTQDSLDKTLDYSHHNTTSMTPPGATVGDEADNSRAKRRFTMHQNACTPFLEYFKSKGRLVSVDVSSGVGDAIWDKIHEFFTTLNMHAWRPVDCVLVFAMDGMQVGSLDFTETEMTVIELKDVVSDPNGSLDCLLTGLTSHIDALADDNHYFVINTEGTSIVDHYKNHTEVPKRSIVFSDRHGGEGDSACVNKFSVNLNNLCGGPDPWFKAVCSADDETLLFPVGVNDSFCEHVAILMASKHPSKQ
jgi:adenylate kinase family enzyme